MTQTPLISVIMPVYNTEQYVAEAIESILNQTFSDFEFIIIDDGSTDSSREIIQHYAAHDERIRAYQNEVNKGIAYTRNKLIDLTETNYIASQDSDDISLPQRLQLSYDFLEQNPNYAVVSGDNIIIDENGKTIGYRKYSNNIKNIILKKSPISQPASMFRKDIYHEMGGYDPQLDYGEDYDLRLKFWGNGHGIMNLNKNFLKYRIREGQTKSNRLKETIQNTIFIQQKAIKEQGIKPSISDKAYNFLEKCLLLLPSSTVMRLFRKTNYKNI